MEVLKASVKRILSLLLLAMVLSAIPCVALAANGGDPADDAVINFNAKGSITVTKYATTSAITDQNRTSGTGVEGQTPNEIYRTIEGVTFKLFKIADADAVKEYYNGTSTATYELAKFKYVENGTSTYNGTPITETKEGITREDGTYKFEKLPVGIYVLKEVTAPDQITERLAEDSLISIPMVNTATSSNNENAMWMYDVYVYPKNKASTGTVELTKQDQNGNALAGVTFELYKKDFNDDGSLPVDWEQVTSAEGQSLSLTTDEQGKLTLADLSAEKNGTQYKLVEVSAPAGYIVNQTPLYFKVNRNFTLSWNNAEGDQNDCNNKNTGVVGTPVITAATKLSITLRNEMPSLTKQVKENGGTAWKSDEQYRLDDEITYRLIVYVPNNVAELAAFTIQDLPQTGITDSIGCTVTYGDTADACTSPVAADNFTVSAIAAGGSNGQGFELTLTEAGKATVAGKYIQIVYTAHMNANAVIAGSGNGNTAILTYSKYIGKADDSSTYAITDEARVYTYQYKITKHLKNAATQTLAGAGVEFQLLDSDQTTLIKVVALNIVDGVDQGGSYRLAITGETGIDTMKTGADGTLTVKGLENGTYYLKETKTLAGYNLLSEPFEIQLKVTETTTWNTDGTFTASGKVVKTYGNNTTYSPDNAMGTSTIINKSGFVLPQTGGMGYLLFCAVGIALIAGGAMLIFGGRKKKIR